MMDFTSSAGQRARLLVTVVFSLFCKKWPKTRLIRPYSHHHFFLDQKTQSGAYSSNCAMRNLIEWRKYLTDPHRRPEEKTMSCYENIFAS
jgi:hypothetical protein